MPDDDRFPRGLPRLWLAVRRGFEQGDDPETLSRLTEKALAATIRNIGGVPAIREICDEAHQVARARAGILPIDGVQPGLFPRKGRLPQEELAWSRARVLVETRTEELAGDPEVARHKVAASVVRALAYHFGFGRFVPGLIDSRLWSADEIRERCTQILARPGIDKLADSLLRHPHGLGVKAPPHRRPSAEEMLGTALEDL